MTARLLVNPAAGRRRGHRLAARLAAAAAARGLAVELSTSREDLVARARRASAEGVERLLVAGGDGTWHWVAQALAGSDTALAPLPVGTGNDLARELRVPFEPERALANGLEGGRVRIDLGRVGERWFCGVAGVGLDAAVAERARSRFRWLCGPLVYVSATLATLPRFRSPRIEVEAEGRRFAGEVFFVAFANGSHYGGGMRVAPGADPTDGLLDVVVVRRCSKLHLLRIFPRVYRGTHLADPAVEVLRAPSATLRLSSPQPLNLDGEDGGQLGEETVRIEAVRGALAVVVGPHWAQHLATAG